MLMDDSSWIKLGIIPTHEGESLYHVLFLNLLASFSFVNDGVMCSLVVGLWFWLFSLAFSFIYSANTPNRAKFMEAFINELQIDLR